MGHYTGLNDLLCIAVKLFIYSYHIIDQEPPLPMHDSIHVHIFQPRIKADRSQADPPVRDPNYVQNFSAYERVYTVIKIGGRVTVRVGSCRIYLRNIQKISG